MLTKRIAIALTVLSILALLLSACAQEPTTVGTTAATTAATAQQTTTATTAQETTASQTQEKTAEPDPVLGQPELIWQNLLENRINSIAMHPDGIHLAVGEYKVTFIYQLAGGDLAEVIIHEHSVEDLHYSTDGQYLAAGQGYYGVLISDMENKEQQTLLHRHNSRAAYAAGSERLATADRGGEVFIWDASSYVKVATLVLPGLQDLSIRNRWVNKLAFHPDNQLLAVTQNDNNVYIWDLEQAAVMQTLAYRADVTATRVFSFLPDGQKMVLAVVDGGTHQIHLLDVATAEPLQIMTIPERVIFLDVSPDGRLLVVGSRLATTLWDLTSGELLYTFEQDFAALAADSILIAQFTPDGGHVCVARNDNSLELWRLPGAEPLVAPPIDLRQPPPLPGDVLFDTNSADIKSEAFPELAAFAEELFSAFPKAHLTFIGHTDSRGDAANNQRLSLDRAQSISDWFTDWADSQNIDGWSFAVDGRGSSELKVPDFNIEGDFLQEAGALNRRVEIEVEVDT